MFDWSLKMQFYDNSSSMVCSPHCSPPPYCVGLCNFLLLPIHKTIIAFSFVWFLVFCCVVVDKDGFKWPGEVVFEFFVVGKILQTVEEITIFIPAKAILHK